MHGDCVARVAIIGHPIGQPQVLMRLAVDEHLVVRVAGALDHDGAELHDHVLRGQRAGNAELEDARIGVAEPVILDQVLGDDVGGQHRRADRGFRCRAASTPG